MFRIHALPLLCLFTRLLVGPAFAEGKKAADDQRLGPRSGSRSGLLNLR